MKTNVLIMSSNCDSCPSKGKCDTDSSKCSKIIPKYGKIKHIIGVISGKGGVGKSTVTGILAVELNKQGYKVGVLDADITGPSMPRFFGINNQRAEMHQGDNGTEEVIFEPVTTKSGIKVMSLNLLTEKEEEPVIWRGPVITGVLTQMYADTKWGDIDYLLIDMPPGTGDVALTIMQSTPVEAMVVVSTPQDMVSMIVKKVINMAGKLNIDILGVVENMSYILCTKCGEKIRVFSKTPAIEQAKHLNVPLLAELPINLELVENMENGKIEEFIASHEEYDTLYKNFMNKLKYTE